LCHPRALSLSLSLSPIAFAVDFRIFRLPSMSISVDGVLCATVGRGLSLVNTVSSRFFGAHFSGRDPLVPFQITLSTASRGTFTTSLTFSVDPLLPVDVALGLRWKAYVREWLLASGELVPSSFDPWDVFLGDASPLAFLGPGKSLPRSC
jgi:hypothetical protein